MKDLQLADTGGHREDGSQIARGDLDVDDALDYVGEIELCVSREWPNGGRDHACAYLSVEQAKKLRKHLKRVVKSAGAE